MSINKFSGFLLGSLFHYLPIYCQNQLSQTSKVFRGVFQEKAFEESRKIISDWSKQCFQYKDWKFIPINVSVPLNTQVCSSNAKGDILLTEETLDVISIGKRKNLEKGPLKYICRSGNLLFFNNPTNFTIVVMDRESFDLRYICYGSDISNLDIAIILLELLDCIPSESKVTLVLKNGLMLHYMLKEDNSFSLSKIDQSLVNLFRKQKIMAVEQCGNILYIFVCRGISSLIMYDLSNKQILAQELCSDVNTSSIKERTVMVANDHRFFQISHNKQFTIMERCNKTVSAKINSGTGVNLRVYNRKWILFSLNGEDRIIFLYNTTQKFLQRESIFTSLCKEDISGTYLFKDNLYILTKNVIHIWNLYLLSHAQILIAVNTPCSLFSATGTLFLACMNARQTYDLCKLMPKPSSFSSSALCNIL